MLHYKGQEYNLWVDKVGSTWPEWIISAQSQIYFEHLSLEFDSSIKFRFD